MSLFQIKELLFWISVGSVSLVTLYVVFKQIHSVFNITFVVCIIFILAFASTWYSMYMVRTFTDLILFYLNLDCIYTSTAVDHCLNKNSH